MKKTLLNGRWLFLILVFSLLIVLSVYMWDPTDWGWGVFGIGAGSLFVLGTCLLTPCAYRFDERGLTLYYGFLIRTRAEWKEIRYIYVQFSSPSFPQWDEYCIGSFPAKLSIYKEGRIPKTGKTTKLLQTYWHRKIG